MSEIFHSLPDEKKREAILAAAEKIGVTPEFIEKDFWVCWCLKVLFEMPDREHFVFKGGTSLSKVHDAISRFSEDIDITIDYRFLDSGIAGPNLNLSSRQRANAKEDMESSLRKYVTDVVEPYFNSIFLKEISRGSLKVEIQKAGEELHISYVSVLETSNPYMLEPVKMEFGAKNSVEPRAEAVVSPMLAELDPDLELPLARVFALSGERTFWEKVTLAHSESSRGTKLSGERMSRHWYDLFMLSDGSIGNSALNDIELLADVLLYKQSFYYSAASKYDVCLIGELRILPDEDGVDALRNDYLEMLRAGLIYGEPPDFETIITRLRALEREINKRVIAWNQKRSK